jgi:hypothetical protein
VIRLADHSREPWATVYAILVIIKRTNEAMSDGEGYEQRFNCAGFIGSPYRKFVDDRSGGGSKALVGGLPDLASPANRNCSA